MGKKPNQSEENADYSVEKVDPELEAKIDADFDLEKKEPKPEEKKEKSKPKEPVEPETNINEEASLGDVGSQTAPLLPDDKIPILDGKKKKKIKVEDKTDNEESDEEKTSSNDESLEPDITENEESETTSENTSEDTEEDTLAELNQDQEEEDASSEDEVVDPKDEDAEPEDKSDDEVEETNELDEINKKIEEIEEKKEPKPKPEPTNKKKPAKQKLILSDVIGIEDRSTDQAVEDIIESESDRMLAIEDAKAELLAGKKPLNETSEAGKIKKFFASKIFKVSVSLIVLAAIVVIALVPSIRYWVLNTVGVRSSASATIIDEKTGQPLKNATMSIGDQTAKTDIDGKVTLNNLKLGKQQLLITKPAYEDISQETTLGWGSNPLGELKLKAVGSRYVFQVSDFLSNRPVDAEAVSGQYNARADKNGEIVLAINDQQADKIDVQIVAKNYRTEKLTFAVGKKTVQKIKLVPSRKHAFVSKRSGKYDLYKIDVDGKNEQKVLAGTGKETEEGLVILPNKTKNIVAFVSTRGGQFNNDGVALSSLNIVNLDNNQAEEIAVSERIQLVDFIDNKLIFAKIAQGEDESSAKRHRLISYDIDSKQSNELAVANYFNDVLSAQGFIYYSPSEYKLENQVGLYRIKPDGSQKSTLFGQEVWNLFRVDYDKIDASIQQSWYEYNISNVQFNKLSGAPPSLKSRVYADSPDGKKSAWVDNRDGKGVLLIHDKENESDDIKLETQSGLQNPIYWLDNTHVVYRVSDGSQTADYVISIDGGEPKKIIDVTNIAGLDRWYYY